jgi:hypothetical protein
MLPGSAVDDNFNNLGFLVHAISPASPDAVLMSHGDLPHAMLPKEAHDGPAKGASFSALAASF